MKHTLGPWWDESGVIHAAGPEWTEENHSCVHVARINTDLENAEVNSDLICAAPDLLAALEAVINSLRTGQCAGIQMPVEFWAAYDQAKIALARAKGEWDDRGI